MRITFAVATVMRVWEWLGKAIAADPAGWISLFLAIAVILLGAAFWRRTWALMSGVGRLVATGWRGLRRVRVTTVDRLKAEPKPFIVRAQFVVAPVSGLRDPDWRLANVAAGSVATNVHMEVDGANLAVLSGLSWPSVAGSTFVTFQMKLSQFSLWSGITFTVRWVDENGHNDMQTWSRTS